jgi:O-antigen ligase
MISDKIQAYILIAAAFLIAPVSLFAPMMNTTIFIIVALYPTFLFVKQGKFKGLWSSSPVNKIVIVALIYALASCIWAIKPTESLNMWFRLAFFFIGTNAIYVYSGRVNNKELALKALLAGVIISLFLINFELFTGGYLMQHLKPKQPYPIIELNRGSTTLAIISWVAICYVITKYNFKYAVLLTFAVFTTIARLESTSSVLGFFLAATVAFPLVYYKGKTALKAFGILAVIAIFGLAFVAKVMDAKQLAQVLPEIPGAASNYRLYIWDYEAEQAYKKPFFGWGLNSSRSYDHQPNPYIDFERYHPPSHPHNNTLQIWLELGLVGLAIFAAFLYFILLNIPYSKEQRYISGCCAAIVASYFVIGQTGYGVWQNWLIATGLLAFVLLQLCSERTSN